MNRKFKCTFCKQIYDAPIDYQKFKVNYISESICEKCDKNMEIDEMRVLLTEIDDVLASYISDSECLDERIDFITDKLNILMKMIG